MSKYSPIRRLFSWLSRGAEDGSDLQRLYALYDSGAFAEAYGVLREILAKHPGLRENGDFCLLRAQLELAADDNPAKARELLDRVRELGCADMGYYHRLHGEVMWKTGDLEGAIRDYEKSVAIDPSAGNLMMLAQALSMSHDRRATNVWEQFLEKEPADCLAHIYLGMEAVRSGDRGTALLMAKRAERLHPSVDEVFGVAQLYHETGEFQTAIGMYLKANSQNYGDKGSLYAALAACHLSLGEARPGRKYAEWAIHHDPDNEYVKEVWQEYKERFGGDK